MDEACTPPVAATAVIGRRRGVAGSHRRATGAAKARLFAALCCVCGLLMPVRADSLPEYRLKAAFLYNFAAFTEWPESVAGVLNACVYGTDPFASHLDQLEGRLVAGRVLAVRRVSRAGALDACHVVFIASSESADIEYVLGQLGGRPVLTIADVPDAARRGVAINMHTLNDKVTFEANLSAARSQGLTLSSKLLRLAREIHR